MLSFIVASSPVSESVHSTDLPHRVHDNFFKQTSISTDYLFCSVTVVRSKAIRNAARGLLYLLATSVPQIKTPTTTCKRACPRKDTYAQDCSAPVPYLSIRNTFIRAPRRVSLHTRGQ